MQEASAALRIAVRLTPEEQAEGRGVKTATDDDARQTFPKFLIGKGTGNAAGKTS